MGYDHIVEAIGGPTFVDDLSGFHCGPRRALRFLTFLLAVRHAARFSVATHSCVKVVARNVRPLALEAVARFPL
eukprot:11212639-Lingulodinium_polyedra.AAC.1